MADSTRTPDPADVRAGARIRSARIALEMSQSTLAGAIGITFQQVQKYEKGANRISVSRLQAIARIIGVPACQFLDPAQDTDAPARIGDDVLRPVVLLRQMNTVLKALPAISDPAQRRALVQLARSMAEQGEENRAARLDDHAPE